MLKMVAPGSLFVRSVVAEGGSSAEPLDVRCGKRLGGFASSFVLDAGRAGGMKGSGAMQPSSMFYVHEADVVQIHHFLDECSLCDKSLSGDIFMYRGDTPYCSEECRQQQIEVDRAKHRRKKRAALAARREHQHRLRHLQQQPRPPGMDKRWVGAGYARAPALRV